MSWLPWRRRRREQARAEDAAAVQARVIAQHQLDRAEKRWPEVHRAANTFAAEVEAALARRRHP